MLLNTHLGLPTDIVEIQSISVSPDPPEPGQSLTITAIGTAKETIEVRRAAASHIQNV